MQDLLQGSLDLGTKCVEKYRTAERLQLLPPSNPGDPATLGVTNQENLLHKRLSAVQELLEGTVKLGQQVNGGGCGAQEGN